MTPGERAKAFRKFCYDQMIDDVDKEFLVVLAKEFTDAVADEREACAEIVRNEASKYRNTPEERWAKHACESALVWILVRSNPPEKAASEETDAAVS